MEVGNSMIFLLVTAFSLLKLGYCTRTSSLIYYDVAQNSTGSCFRRFNATHQIGCSSDRSGNVGVVSFVTSNADVTELLKNGTNPPYILVMKAKLFEEVARHLLQATDKVNGVLILNRNESDRPDHYSTDYTCPDDRYGIYGSDSCQSVSWNPMGSALMYENYPFPVVTLVHNVSASEFVLRDCYERYNKPDATGHLPGSHRCGMLLKSTMDGAKDTPTCYRRSNLIVNLSPQHYCDPLGNYNLFASLRPLRPDDHRPVIVIASRYDAFSMFTDQYPGIDSATLSFLTVFAVAEAIGKVREQLEQATDKHILFAVFHGEAFDYIGSSRFAYDMRRGLMNFTVDDIEMFIEIGQIGLPAEADAAKVWMHSGLNPNKQVLNFTTLLNEIGNKHDITMSDAPKQQLLPASLQTFLKERKNLPGVVIANHEKQFTNRFYNSMFDVLSVAGLKYPPEMNETEKYDYVSDLAVHMQRVATTVAQSVYQLATGNSTTPDDCSASNTTVANLIYCFAVDPDCELLNSSFWEDKHVKLLKANKKAFLSRYVSVISASADWLNERIFARFLGTHITAADDTAALCDELEKNDTTGYRYFKMRGPINETDPEKRRMVQCVKAAANYSVAVSPAFLEDEKYDWSSSLYSSWTESIWPVSAFEVRVFLMPSYQQEVVTFVVGFLMLIVSFVAVFFIERRSSILFTPATATPM